MSIDLIRIIGPFVLPLLGAIALWIGLVKLGQRNRGKIWLCMLTSGILYTASIFASMAWRISWNHSRDSSTNIMVISVLGRAGSAFGLFGFFLGFAMHAARTANLRDRISELEMLSLAQATELQRLRDP